MRVIVGLGNPGRQYAWTRHNIGFLVVDEIAKRSKIKLSSRRFSSLTQNFRIGQCQVILVKPLTFMNLSGQAVRAIVDYYKIAADELLVVCDDVHLDAGLIRIKTKGTSAGHHGLESIIGHLGSNNFTRMRIGVGRDRMPQDLSEFVLSAFSKVESEIIKETIVTAANACLEWVIQSDQHIMAKYNKKNIPQMRDPALTETEGGKNVKLKGELKY